MLFVLATTLAITQIVRQKKHPEQEHHVDTNEDTEIPTNDDPLKEIINLVNAYNQSGGVVYKGTIKLIDGNTDEDKILEEQKFEYTIFGDEYEYILGTVEMIAKKSFVLLADHQGKSVSVLPVNAKLKTKGFFDLAEFKKILTSQQANVAVTRLSNEKILTIDSIQNQEIQGYKVYYSPETYRINKILIGIHRLTSLEDGNETEENSSEEIADEPIAEEVENDDEGFYYYLEVNYSDIKNLSLKANGFTPENKFIQYSGGKIELKEAFKEYEFINKVEP
jgi:hypothetical protein